VSTTCRCGQPTRDNTYGCERCADQLAHALGDIPWLDDQLETSATKQRGIDYRTLGGGKGGKKPAERPSPVHWSASDARADLHALLVTWVRLCAEEGVRHRETSDDLPADTTPALSRWLLTRVDGLMLHQAASEAVEQIQAAVRRATRMIDTPAEKWFAGPCNECGAELYADAGSRSVDCQACGLTYDTAERRDWLRNAARDHNGTAAEIARAVVVWGDGPASEHLLSKRISKWHERKLIVARGKVEQAGRERTIYRVGDVLDLLERDARDTARKRDVAAS